MKTRAAMGLLVSLAVVGCIPTLHPIYTDEDVVFDDALIGTWRKAENDTESWEFTKRDEKSYTFVYTDKEGLSGKFEGRLVRLDGRLFLDFYPAEGPEGVPAFFAIHLVPAHTFVRVDQIHPTLQMAFMSPDWLEEKLKEEPGALKHEALDEPDFSVVITAPTDELQAFLLKYADDEEAWGEPSDLLSVPQTQPAATQPAGDDGAH